MTEGMRPDYLQRAAIVGDHQPDPEPGDLHQELLRRGPAREQEQPDIM